MVYCSNEELGLGNRALNNGVFFQALKAQIQRKEITHHLIVYKVFNVVLSTLPILSITAQ